MCFRPTKATPSLSFPPYSPIVAVGSPMMTALVDSAQMQAAQFAAEADLSGVLAATSLASSLQGIPATGSIPMHQVASNHAATATAIDFNSPLSVQQLQQNRGVYSTPQALDPQQHHSICSVLREQPRLPEGMDFSSHYLYDSNCVLIFPELDAIAVLGDVTADPQSLRFNYPADSPMPRSSRQKKGNFVYREQVRRNHCRETLHMFDDCYLVGSVCSNQ